MVFKKRTMKRLLIILGFALIGASAANSQDSQVEPPGGLSPIEAYSVYLTNYQNDDYKGAIEYGRWIWQGMPHSIQGHSRFSLETNLNRLIRSYRNLAQNITDPSVRSAYVDTALMIFDKAITEFQDSEEVDLFEWHFDKGRFIQENSDFIDNATTKAAAEYQEAFEIDAERLTKSGEGYYVRVILQEMVTDEEKQQALDLIGQIESYAPEKLKSYFNEVRNRLFDTPEERIGFLKKQLEEDPENTELLKELRSIYRDQGMISEVRGINEQLYQINPSFENTRSLADVAIENANYDTAIKYLKEAFNKAPDNSEKARVALQLSEAYLNKENLQEARRFARQSIDLDSDWGRPYIQMATIYAQTVSQCTSERKMERKDKVVYWVVLDYLDRARSVDSSTANQVERLYKSYEPVTMTTEDKFYWDPPLEAGDNIEVDSNLGSCYDWINESTTVR